MLELCGRGDQIGPALTGGGGEVETNVKERLGFSDLPLSFR